MEYQFNEENEIVLKSKKEKAKHFLQANIHWLQCPICHSPFSFSDDSLVCCHHHRFDVSKKGSTYFLQRQFRTEYGRDMFIARRNMIQHGIYQPMLQVVQSYLPQHHFRLLDVGCGEGSFTQKLKLDRGHYFGMDISKEGIQLATDYISDTQWFSVADLTNLPLASQSTDVILDLFSPAHYEEFHRVLTKDGYVIKIVPSSHYLAELRQAFYHDTARESYSNAQVIQRLKDEMTIIKHEHIHYKVPILDEWQSDVLHMSPIHWAADENQLLSTHISKLTIDVELYVAQF